MKDKLPDEFVDELLAGARTEEIVGVEPVQLRLVALIVDPIAPNMAALRRVSSNVERA